MTLQKIPSELLNVSGEYCFMSCVGLALAHFEKLGRLCLSDIVADIEQPDEEFTPMARALEWLHDRGIRTTYIEAFNESKPENRDFIDGITAAGTVYVNRVPNLRTVKSYLGRQAAVLTQVTYSGEPSGEPDHIVYVKDADKFGTQVIDPDFENPITLPHIRWAWGNSPNLIIAEH